ncbi:MAG TPA: hypothetical protein VF476_11685 [Chitinophagaceae bacterium]
MKIPDHFVEKWRDLREVNDVTDLTVLAGRSQPIITKALNKGEATLKVFNVIKEFYGTREKEILAD